MREKLFTKNFTLLVLGQVSSLFGNFILKFALSMYVLELTGSAGIFAGVLAFATIPTIILSPLGGILADRANRRNIMVALDTLSGISVLCFSLFFKGHNTIVMIGILLVFLSVLGAFESPTVQACVPQMQSGDNIIRGNAVVNQVAAIASLIAPILGSVLYAAFGMKPVMYATMVCFFLTASFECFIKLDYKKSDTKERIAKLIKNDFLVSMRFICREHTDILKMLLLSTLMSFFVVGTALIGLPFIVRNILDLSVKMYGIAESLIGFSAILGGIAAGVLTGKLKINKLFLVAASVGVCFIISGIVYLFPVGNVAKYVVTLIGFCGVQILLCVFSIFALSYIQQRTPSHLTGKVMSYVATVSMCSQPLSQAVYGFLFDKLSENVYLVLVPTGIVILLTGLMSAHFFAGIGSRKEENGGC